MTKAYVDFDSSAPCGFLIRECDDEGRDTGRDVLIQTDWDYPSVASNLGWAPCSCPDAGCTDGTVDCPCGRTVSEMISSASDFLVEHEGDLFDDPGYFGG